MCENICVRRHMWCPDGLAKLWDRIEPLVSVNASLTVYIYGYDKLERALKLIKLLENLLLVRNSYH